MERQIEHSRRNTHMNTEGWRVENRTINIAGSWANLFILHLTERVDYLSKLWTEWESEIWGRNRRVGWGDVAALYREHKKSLPKHLGNCRARSWWACKLEHARNRKPSASLFRISHWLLRPLSFVHSRRDIQNTSPTTEREHTSLSWYQN